MPPVAHRGEAEAAAHLGLDAGKGEIAEAEMERSPPALSEEVEWLTVVWAALPRTDQPL
ncbi:hypothetical protein Agau_L101264 [Agrobacterium tumefaciens F2]|jgi:hypothetical protein|nr:hypothetical protein Agau_L101264 [Agrobacterium tumefaciens F2]